MTASPRFETTITHSPASWAPEIEAAAEGLGTPLMSWQSKGARLLGARREDGLPRYKTVVITVPRQQGKTALSRSAIKARAEQAANLRLFGTAQSRQYAAKHVVDLGVSLLDDVKLLRGVGAESVTFPNGSIYAPISPTEGGGHGDSIDFMLVDEGWTLTAVVMGGIRPAMIARPQSQLLIISTMGTVESDVWNDIVARGRESVENPDSTMAYLEYSAPDDQAVFDPDRWVEWMPALGHTVTHADIQAAIEDMEPQEAIRAFGNRVTKTLSVVFPDEWVQRSWRVIEPPARMVLAIDVNDEPLGAAVVSAHLTDEGAAVRVVEWRHGSAIWLPGLVERICTERKVDAIVGDFGGPARIIRAELQAVAERLRVPLVERVPRDVAADTGGFYDALREGRVQVERSEPLVDAFAGAYRKDLGDLWVVSRRRMTVDASPLIAAVMAHGVAIELGVAPVVRPFVL